MCRRALIIVKRCTCIYLITNVGGRFRIRIKVSGDFPGGPVVKNPPSNAGDVGSIPGWGTKIPHDAGQLSPCAATTEPVHLN